MKNNGFVQWTNTLSHHRAVQPDEKKRDYTFALLESWFSPEKEPQNEEEKEEKKEKRNYAKTHNSVIRFSLYPADIRAQWMYDIAAAIIFTKSDFCAPIAGIPSEILFRELLFNRVSLVDPSYGCLRYSAFWLGLRRAYASVLKIKTPKSFDDLYITAQNRISKTSSYCVDDILARFRRTEWGLRHFFSLSLSFSIGREKEREEKTKKHEETGLSLYGWDVIHANLNHKLEVNIRSASKIHADPMERFAMLDGVQDTHLVFET
jgi:hypothetical protein